MVIRRERAGQASDKVDLRSESLIRDEESSYLMISFCMYTHTHTPNKKHLNIYSKLFEGQNRHSTIIVWDLHFNYF